MEAGLSASPLTVAPVRASEPETVVVPVVPVTDADWLLPIAVVVAVKVAVVAPAATVTVAGTVTAALLELRVTTVPPVGAAPVIVTVPVELVPPATLAGLKLSALITGVVTVRTADAEVLLNAAEIVEVPLTANVVIGKVAVVLPAATVTEAGTVAAAVLEDVRVTISPPVPAALARVTVPVEGVTPATVEGLRLTDSTVAAVTVRVFVTDVVPVVAVTTTGVVVATELVVAVNVAVEAPAGTVTDPGTVTAALPDERPTARPPEPAVPARVRVPVEDVPPVTEDGEKVIVLITAGSTGRANLSVIPQALAVRLAVTLLGTT